MGTLAGHIVPGFALALLGIWHIVNTIRAYHLKGSRNFMLRYWYPFKGPFLMLELVLIFSFSIFAIFSQILDLPRLHFASKLDSFEHATMFLHLAILSGFTLFSELANLSKTLSGVSGVLLVSLFSQELFLLRYHSADHVGLEGHCHWLLQLIVFTSLMAAIFVTSFPSSFPSALVLSLSVLFQGCWFLNMGMMLWVPRFVPSGCYMQMGDEHGAVVCGTLEAETRARALANLQFSWILSGILIFVGSVSLIVSAKLCPRGQTPEYEQLHSKGAVDLTAINVFKQVNP